MPSAAAGDHLRASFGSGPRQILLLGHFDTVWPVGQLARMPLKRDGGRLHGPGVFDMKAGIGLATLATRAVIERRRLDGCRIVMLWTTDEEIGSTTSRALIEAEATKSDAVLVFEPSLPGGALKTSRKGVGQFEMIARGVSAHAGLDPGKGVSAVRELARQIIAIDDLQDPANGVTLTVGIVSRRHARERRARRSPRHDRRARDHARRCRSRAARDAVAAAAASRARQLEVTGGFDRPPLERTAACRALFDAGEGGGRRDRHRRCEEGSAGGGSDGNFTAALGVPTLDGFGAIGDGAHALHEHVEIDALVPRAATDCGSVGSRGPCPERRLPSCDLIP